MNNIKKLTVQKMLSVLLLGVGVILLINMITTEDEPGALPLLLIIIGAGWYFITRTKLRSVRNIS